MAKIINKALINVWTELILDEPNRTYEFVEAWNMVAKDWINFQVFYSKLVDLWATSTYQDSPFPMNQIDAKSGQYQIGIDAGWNPNGWKPKNQATRDMQRDCWWEEYDAAGTLLMTFVGIVWLGAINSWAQWYYKKSISAAPIDFVYDDMPNIWVQVYWNVDNGNFDDRSYFKSFVREQWKKYTDSVLADTGNTATDAYMVSMLLSNEDDLKISDLDIEMTNAPYNNITVEYFAVDQVRSIWGSNYNFDVIVDWNNATLEQIYTKLQYLLRQATDIDNGAWTVIWKTANLLAWFVWDTLETTLWVYIDNILDADSNRIKFMDTSWTNRENPFESAGAMSFNWVMIWAWSSFRMMYTTWPWAWDDYWEAWAITVNDASGTPITWVITAWSIDFTFDFDNDTAGWPAGTEKNFTLIWVRPWSSKFAVATWVLSKSKAISVWLVAETDRWYL